MKLLDELYQERTALAINKYVAKKSFIFQLYIHTLEIQCMGSSILSLRQEIRHQGCCYLLFSGASTIQWNFTCVPGFKEAYVDMLFSNTLYLSYSFERKRSLHLVEIQWKDFPGSFGRAPFCVRGTWWLSASSDSTTCTAESVPGVTWHPFAQGVACPLRWQDLCVLLRFNEDAIFINIKARLDSKPADSLRAQQGSEGATTGPSSAAIGHMESGRTVTCLLRQGCVALGRAIQPRHCVQTVTRHKKKNKTFKFICLKFLNVLQHEHS